MGTDALAIINTRRSTRKFTTDPVGAADVRDLLEAAMNAPSAVNEQAWQFVVLSGTVLEDYLKINANTPKGATVAHLRRSMRGEATVRGCGCSKRRRRWKATASPPEARLSQTAGSIAEKETGRVETFSDGNLVWRTMVRGDPLGREVPDAHARKIGRLCEVGRT